MRDARVEPEAMVVEGCDALVANTTVLGVVEHEHHWTVVGQLLFKTSAALMALQTVCFERVITAA